MNAEQGTPNEPAKVRRWAAAHPAYLFGNAVLGAAAGGTASLYFPNIVWIYAVSTGLGAVALPLLSVAIRRRVWIWLAGVIAVATAVALAYATVITDYGIGEDATVKPREKAFLQRTPGRGNAIPRPLARGTKVTVLDVTWRRYLWQRTEEKQANAPTEDVCFYYFEHHYKVKTSSGRVGWIYGGFLTGNRHYLGFCLVRTGKS